MCVYDYRALFARSIVIYFTRNSSEPGFFFNELKSINNRLRRNRFEIKIERSFRLTARYRGVRSDDSPYSSLLTIANRTYYFAVGGTSKSVYTYSM